MSVHGQEPRAFLTDLFQRAVQAADPMRVVAQHLPPRPAGRLLVIGAGKASARMAEAVEAHYGPCEGYVITRYGYARPCEGIEIVEAAHPVPDQAGLEATQELLRRVSGLGPDDTVLALISGGGSALLCAPAEGLTLADKQDVNRALLSSGAPIGEMNVVRAALSQVKGGKLAAACAPAPVLTLLISDVPGDNPAEVASGPTVSSPGTPEQALEILDRRQIDVAPHVRDAIARASGPAAPNQTEARIVAAPSLSLAAAQSQAEAQGCRVQLLGDSIEGEARELAVAQVELALKTQASLAAGDAPVLLLSGGECTVTRRGDGVGGPNAEYTLAALVALNGQPGIHVMACDTDGVDGAAEVAGAYAGPHSLEHSSLDAAQSALAANNAHGYFGDTGGQIVTGPTLTNVNDFRAILIFPSKD